MIFGSKPEPIRKTLWNRAFIAGSLLTALAEGAMLAFHGLAYSLFPWLVMDQLTIWQAAAAPESLKVILVGAVLVLPVIILYTLFAYRVFHGKATSLEYY